MPQLSQAVCAQDEETAAITRREIAEERRKERIRVGDSVSEEGNPLCVIRPGNMAPQANVPNLRLPSPPIAPPQIFEGMCRKCRGVAQVAHRCDKCGSCMHPWCGRGIGEECHGQPVCCEWCED